MNQNRREFIGATLITFIAGEMGAIEPQSSFGPLKQIDAGVLNVGYAEAGPASGRPVILLHRWRLGVAEGESKYDDLEKRLAEAPVIAVPTITLEGDANGAPHPDPSAYAKKFSGKYEHRLISGGVGHNLPQEAPRAFADAIMEVDRLSG